MMESESDDRRPIDCALFALAFLALLIALGGTIMTSVAAALTGFFLLLFCLFCYWVAQPAAD